MLFLNETPVKANAPKQKIAGMEIIAVERVEEAVAKMR